MKFIKTKSLAGVLLFLLTVGFAGCNDNDPDPITLADREDSNITMFWRGEETSEYAFSLRGGDGHYSVQSGNEEVVVAEMVTSNLHLKPKGIGETIVTVTDNSKNALVLNVQVDYETHNLVVVHHDVSVTGGYLTGNEVKAIREQQLAQILVKVGGGYRFIFTDYTDAPNGKGVAVIYPEKFGSGGIETTFEVIRELKGDWENAVTNWGYEVKMDDEKRLFVVGRYAPSPEGSTRKTMSVTPVLMEDVTEKVRAEYPKAELVYTSQVIEGKVY